MMKSLSRERPHCKEILKQKDLWALSDSEFEIHEDSKEVIASKLNSTLIDEYEYDMIIYNRYQNLIVRYY